MGLYFISVLWDLRQFYENVPWDLLAKNCSITSCPIAAQRMAVQRYQCPRYLLYDGMLMDPLHPTGVSWLDLPVLRSRRRRGSSRCWAFTVRSEGGPCSLLSLHVDDLSQDQR
eukprot:3744052-Pyramimonas_sp.AAC.1